jgi:hypothetical protein
MFGFALSFSSTQLDPKRRAVLRVAGSGPLKLCRPETPSESFRLMCESESLSLANDPHEAEMLDWIAKVSDSDVS